jgi:outer membrane protein assembly factor BamB
MARVRRIGGLVAALVGLAVLVPVAGPAVAAVDPAGGWPQFRGAPDHSGSTSASSITAANVASLAPAWHYQASATVSSPAVVGGVAYVGSTDHNVYAFAADGHGCTTAADCPPLWKGPTGGQIHSSPAVAGGIVYASSLDHLLYAFDASGLTGCTGTPAVCPPLWTAAMQGQGQVDSSPVVAGGVVYGASEHRDREAAHQGQVDLARIRAIPPHQRVAGEAHSPDSS